jgi:hypothetical protein
MASKKKGRVEAAMGRKVVLGWILAPLALILISLAMCTASRADEGVGWFSQPPYVFIGLDSTLHGGVVCYSDATNRAEANLGAGIPLYGALAWQIAGQWTHHSCAFDEDRQVYDGFGIQLRWYPTQWRKE